MGENQRIITLAWNNKDKIGVWKRTYLGDIHRHCSESLIVPKRKIWILLYGTISIKYALDERVREYFGSEIKIESPTQDTEVYETSARDKGITFREAIDRKLRVYEGSVITGFTPGDYEGSDTNADSEVFFLEIAAN